ncbi:hypothetical protein AVEN_20950-1 [Araneus ventricosus]|uniref:Uncharacterized protein n=1 Tax=Araneus ventricosus TaxID=182803 RepID=A0A4Y2GGJ4_ARAVE|nr:hypothetical protein AVEN_134580-1 [Araneus ventricosus]GBN76801.1 hypothetical protein AVEN_20950-1 [Araneus ventricosus]
MLLKDVSIIQIAIVGSDGNNKNGDADMAVSFKVQLGPGKMPRGQDIIPKASMCVTSSCGERDEFNSPPFLPEPCCLVFRMRAEFKICVTFG